MASAVTIRSATRRDAADLVVLEDMASLGMANRILRRFLHTTDAQTAFEFGRQRVLDETVATNFRNALIAEIDGEVAGASISHVLNHDPSADPSAAPVPELVPLSQLKHPLDRTWYIDTVAVYREQRGHGIAGQLIAHEMQRCRDNGYKTLALTAEDGNENAVRLYHHLGFEIVDRRGFIAMEDIPSTSKNWLLMARAV